MSLSHAYRRSVQLHVEALEERTVLTTSTSTPLFGCVDVIESPTDHVKFSFQMDASRFNFDDHGKVRLLIVATREDGSTVDIGTLRFTSANKKNTPDVGASRKDYEGTQSSAAAVKFKPGTYEVEIKSERQTTGWFTLKAFLLGDVSNDRIVNATDLAMIKALKGKRQNDLGFNSAADANLNGRIDLEDYVWTGNNQGSRYRSKSSLAFDGQGDFANIPLQGSLNSIFANQRFTMEVWIQVDQWYDDTWFSVVDTGQWTIQIESGSGLEFTSYAGGTKSFGFVPELGQRYHIAVNFDQARGTIILFVNGELYGELPLTAPLEQSDRLVLGINPFGALEYSHGLIDDLRIWSTNRTAEEIQMNYHKELKGSEPGLLGYWTFNESQGMAFFDRTSNSAKGFFPNFTLYMPTWWTDLLTS